MKSEPEEGRLEEPKHANVPLICEAGAARSIENLPRAGLREIRSITGARRSDQFCAAVIVGSSLADDGILDGDCIIVRLTFERHELTPGRLVAVLTPCGLLVKHIYLTLDDRIRLVSANPAYEDMLLDLDQVTVQGIAVRIERDL
jgi:SOS-response transcriptional repressor LexA